MNDADPGDPHSPESREWLRRVRANVKAQLFGGTDDAGGGESDTSRAAAPSTEDTHAADGVPPKRADPDEDPNRIGRFVVIKRIGEGGMGLVFAAYDDTLDRKVAVKLLHPRGAGSREARTRLIREAQALARLSHPSVIHVYEVGTLQEQVYVAMEFVDGGTLRQWQRQEGRHWREVLDAYVAAGRGLAAAHAAGIVHRDFKAANVLVRRDGAVRVVDFGLARQELAGTSSVSRPVDREMLDKEVDALPITGELAAREVPLTRTGTIMGTPAYMAPEQFLGHKPDPRGDQFSYCVSLFEALYGFRPFPGETMHALRANVLRGRLEQPPRYTDIPPRIFKVLERGLRVHPEDRYPAMENLLDDLVRDPRAALQRLAYAVLAVLVVGLVAMAWWSERDERAARAEGERLRAQFDRARMLNAEDELRRAQSRTVSQRRDDLVLAYAREVIDDDPTVALAALKHLTPGNTDWLPAARTLAADAVQRGVVQRRLSPELGRIGHMRFVDDNRQLVIAGNGIVRWDLEHDTLVRLADPGVALRDVSVTPSGQRIVAIGLDDTVYLWSLESDARGPAAGPDGLRRIPSDDDPPMAVALSPDGHQLAIGSRSGRLRLLDWEGKTLRTIFDHKAPIRSLHFSLVADELVSASEDGALIIWFLDREKHRTLDHGPGIRTVRFDGQGDFVWSTAEDGTVRRWTTSTGKARRATRLAGATLLARTPSGDHSLVCRSDRELVVLSEAEPQTLQGIPAVVTAIAMSDDGAWAAAATGDERVQIWRLTGSEGKHSQPDGSRTTSTPGPITALAFSRAGGLLASATRQGQVQLWSEQGEPRGELGRHGRTILDLGFSPQGHELAAHDEDGGITVWSVADRDQPSVRLRNHGSLRSAAWVWSPDGERIAAPVCEGLELCTVELYPVAGGEPRSLATTDAPASALRFSPQGQYLLSDHPTGSWLWDLGTGQGRALEWPAGEQPSRRLAFAWVRGGIRMATEDALRDAEAQVVSTTLRVWHVDVDSGNVHLLFQEPELRALLVDAQHETLLLRTLDDHTLLWQLAGDHFRVLPEVGRDYDRFLISPDARALLLRPRPDRARSMDGLWVDVESGLTRRFSRRSDPVAWSVRGTLADVPVREGLRLWRDPTPDEVGSFLRWLDKVTDATVDAASIR